MYNIYNAKNRFFFKTNNNPNEFNFNVINNPGCFLNKLLLQDVTHGKPHPETFLKAAAAIGVDPAFCVGYEDAPLGMEAIHNAGFMKAIDVTKLEGYPKLI